MTTVDLDGLNAFPILTMGVMRIAEEDTVAAVHEAIALGYRSFDTSPVYGNEAATGEAIRSAPVPREALFVTTKLWNNCHGYDEALGAFDRTVQRLGLDFVDLYLIHWPVPTRGLYVDSWKALVRLKAEGRIGAIGVSNFLPEHLDRIIDATGIAPAVNQIELHPSFQQAELRAYHDRAGIRTQAWSPLGHGGDLAHATLAEVAATHDRSAAQVALRWLIQRGVLPVAKARSPAHMAANLQVHDFMLSEDELRRIDALDCGRSAFGYDPRTFEAPPGMEDVRP